LNSLIIEIQRLAMDGGSSVSELLRRSKAAAVKLGNDAISDWIEKELNGYRSGDTVPDYRKVTGRVRAWNPYNGWIPIQFADPEYEKALCTRPVGQSIPELENVFEGEKDSTAQMHFPPKIKSELMQGMDMPFEPVLIVAHSSLARIMNNVRSEILDWSLELEKEGVLGDGLTFTDEERNSAKQVSFNIFDSQNVTIVGEATESARVEVHQEFENGALDIGGIKDLLAQIESNKHQLDEGTSSEIAPLTESLQSELDSPTPDEMKISGLLTSLKAIAEAAAGNLTAAGIAQLISQMLSR